MSEDFNLDSAMNEISSGLGFSSEGEGEGTGAEDGLDFVDSTVVEGEGGEKPAAETSQTKPEEKASVAEGEKPADKAATATEDPAAKVPTSVNSAAPRTWRPEAAAEWAKVPSAVRAEILKREEDMFKGLEQYKTDAGFGKTMQRVLEPFMPVLQQYKLDPITTVNNLLNAQYQLALGTPEQKVAMFTQLMQEYGISADHLTGVAEVPRTDPEVLRLREELNTIKSNLTERQQADIAAAEEKATREVNAFADDPKNVHFDAVAPEIVRLIQAGVCKTLPEAYEKAVWSNPVTRAAEIARQQAEKETAAKKEREAQAAAAKETVKANVRTRSRSADTAARPGTMDDTLSETLAQIKSRQAS